MTTSHDNEASPGRAVRARRTQIRAAHGMLIVTPEYDSSVPGLSSVHERFGGDELIDAELAACLRAMMIEIADAVDARVKRLVPA